MRPQLVTSPSRNRHAHGFPPACERFLLMPKRKLLQRWRELVVPAGAFVAALGLTTGASQTYQWAGTTGLWSGISSWLDQLSQPTAPPTGTNSSDELVFSGNVGTAAAPTTYTATNDIGTLFALNRVTLNAANTGGDISKPSHIIAASTASNVLNFSGANREIIQNGAGAVTFSGGIRSTGTLTFSGNGAGQVTLDGAVAGRFNIVKNGTSVFRFGSAASGSPSPNSWIGTLTINGGIIRFNNNADSAPTALRSNPIVFTSAGSSLTTLFKSTDPSSSLRVGTLSGASGLIESQRTDSVNPALLDSGDIVITTIGDGTFGGTVRNSFTAADANADNGDFIVRGTGNQTLTGTLQIAKDVSVGRGATLTLAGSASMATQAKGAIVLNGGKFVLDNSTTNLSDNNSTTFGRLRNFNGSTTSTAIEPIGGGTFSLIGNAAGTTEYVDRLQLGIGAPRSGALNVNVTSNSSTAPTILNINNLSRDGTTPTFATVNFTANGGAADLGVIGNTPQIRFTNAPAAPNGVLQNTVTTEVGWAVVTGTSTGTGFANYSAGNGIIAAATTALTGTSPAGSTFNYKVTATTTQPTGSFEAQTLTIAPSISGQLLSSGVTGSFKARGVLLAGPYSFQLGRTSAAVPFNSTDTRYFHVLDSAGFLNVTMPMTGTGAIVKSGPGTMQLSGSNSATLAPTVINEGYLRASSTGLPGGQLSFRGGVLEITGGATFTRSLGTLDGQVNWSGYDNTIDTQTNQPKGAVAEDRGSGGFAAVGAAATVTIGGASPTNLAWEDAKFLNSGHALIFGSPSADSRIEMTNNLSLTATSVTVNYNAREIRVEKNANANAADFARMSGVISGTIYNDLMKTGPGILELRGNNTYAGATLVQSGTVLVTGSISGSLLTTVYSGAKLGGGNDSNSLGVVGKVRVEDGGAITPGDALGHASILKTGDVDFSGPAAKLSIEIGGLTAGGDGVTGHDLLKVNGTVSLNGATLDASLLNGFSPQDGLFFLIDNDGTDPVAGFFAQGGSIDIGGQTFMISYTGDIATGQFSVAGGNDVVIAIPEPTAGLLALGGVALLGLRRRRR